MNRTGQERAHWPYKSLILFGLFGPSSPQGKRLILLSTLGLLLFLISFVGTQLLETAMWKYVSAIQMPTAVLIVIYANTAYIKSLDSLEKLIQLTAFTAAYGAAILVGITGFALYTVTGHSISPLWLLLAEPLRGLILYFTARKYQ